MTTSPPALVAIGASAGGIDAFHKFFSKMPPDSGLAFVVVLHLAPNHRSMLPEILSRWTSMSVQQAHDGAALTANRVLVIPPGVIAELVDGHLRLHGQSTNLPRAAAPIDAFFDSVASSLAEDAIGIILSGTGHDGALGLKAIKSKGGLTFAQASDGSKPEYPGMPDSAVAAGAVDLYVSVEDMPSHILATCHARIAMSDQPDVPAPDEGQIRLAICEILRSRLGHDFYQYKHQTFMRRVQRRMLVLRLSRYDDYVRCLQTDREQVTLLFRDLLISVTKFFRDSPTFAVLERDIIPRLFQGKDASSDLRVWVPGCATGEEAYSLAILIREHMDSRTVLPKVQIFASDIDDVSIGTARAGRYPKTLLEGISPERLQRFFQEDADGYAVRQEIREICTFSAHSLIRDPPFSRMDLISCRNLLIYLDNNLQDRVIPIFHYALSPRGILVLGTSETIARHESLFQPLDRSNRIYIRPDGPSDLPSISSVASAGSGMQLGLSNTRRPASRAQQSRAVGFANQRVLDRFATPFVIVKPTGEVMHVSGSIGRFLQPAVGTAHPNLFQMADAVLALELRAALRRCVEMGHPVEHLRPLVATDGALPSLVKLIIEPLPDTDTDRLYMIGFIAAQDTPAAGRPEHLPSPPDTNAAMNTLAREARDLREQLQSLSEEHATAIEELRSSNEELQSVNEELQSTNEELETSREEIQSINEELNTVNCQLSTKVEQLDRTNSDLKNLFDSTKVATVFLDPFLIIRGFTPEIAHIYNLIPSDVGRPLSDIVSKLSYTTLRQDVQSVLQTLQPLEKRVERLDRSTYYLMRILPYRSLDSTIDGSLVTFVDVTSIVRAEEHQRLLVDELNHRVKNMLTVVISLATNTLRQADTLDGFREVFLGRIHALTAAYALLSRDAWTPVLLREILMEELKPFLSNGSEAVTLTGPAVLLEPRAALAMGMAVHELITNAVKYGALSVAHGSVDISWEVEKTDDGQVLVLLWKELGGPPVVRPGMRGFGMTLVERAFAHDVRGEARVEFMPNGVVATLRAPIPILQQKEKS